MNKKLDGNELSRESRKVVASKVQGSFWAESKQTTRCRRHKKNVAGGTLRHRCAGFSPLRQPEVKIQYGRALYRETSATAIVQLPWSADDNALEMVSFRITIRCL